MNYLAHLLLAGGAEADQVGGLLGDFVRGPLPCGLPPDLAAGVALHRQIDSFADAHPLFIQSRRRVSAERRRVAGIMVDLFYDHFLACHWSRFSALPLTQFTALMYARLAAREAQLPERLRQLLPRMRADDWLAGYREPARVAQALDNLGRYRLRQPNRLPGAGAELLLHYRQFESDFLDFFPDALAFTAAQRRNRPA